MSDQPSGQVPFEQQKWAHEIQREDAKGAHDRNRKFIEALNDAAVKCADTTLRTAILINGGAAVSILAFIGGLITKDKMTIAQLRDVSGSLMYFAFGVAAALAALALSYFVHYATVGHAASYTNEWQHPYVIPGKHTTKWAWLKGSLHVLAIFVALASLVFFVCGMFDVRNAIIRLGG